MYMTTLGLLFHLFLASQVLLLDADSQPLVNPESLFELPAYRMHGSQFWPDFVGAGGECVSCQLRNDMLSMNFTAVVVTILLTTLSSE